MESRILINKLVTNYFRRKGDGKVLVFLHGWQDSLGSFSRLIAKLPDNFDITAVDLPGFGKSEAPRKAWSVGDYVDFVSAFIKKVGIKNDYYLVGHSFGGRIIIKGQADGRLSSRKIILIASAGNARRKNLRNFTLKLLSKVAKFILIFLPWRLRAKIKNRLYVMLKSDYNQARTLKQTFLKTVREDLSNQAKQIKVPVLIIWGENDTSTPLVDGQRLSQEIKASELSVINKASHFVHQEEAEKVSNLITKFLC